ncbi:hypothetical protein BO94DRAFT_31250 [Aspergillus sclerotioniger CBS 115572]|uniref:Hydrophobic surface binding protein A n=1 Tax=Aspergillus sclerotioniger CBS 115572 TaxID=1450535 RepID=A0A317WW78_9EURO|nr:hypothetical protein BO94DRAFT_31250 [Aspergillus sclerotioniger CBS 115572]PWY90593.1 hypothetical protein BO94DRAFT_31250 [Aspergillus sclerotioniger CBS 115572]
MRPNLPSFLLTLGTITTALATPTPTTHSVKITIRDSSIFTEGLAAVSAKVDILDANILTYPGGDISNITAGAAGLITTLLAETKEIQSYFLNTTEATAVIPPLEELTVQFATAVNNYISIHDLIKVADEGWYIYSQLQEEHTAALTYTGSVVARIPAGNLKDAANALATNITDTLQTGVVAYKDIAVRPTPYPRA